MSLSKGFSSSLHTGAAHLKTFAEKLHVPAPKGLLSIFPTQGNELEHLHLDPRTCRIHIGKMTKANNNLYTTDMMKGLIESLLPCLKKPTDRITIVLWTQMATFLLDDESKQTMLSIEEQTLLLRNLIAKKFPKHRHLINLVDVRTLHPEVFEILEQNKSETHIEPLHEEICPPLPKTPDSQAILRRLYWCAQHCPKFFEDLQNTKTEHHRQQSTEIGPHKSDYYALVEVALRITDYLNGISIHGGMKRQEAFDEIIRNLIFKNTYGKSSVQLQAFFERAQKNLPTQGSSNAAGDDIIPFKALYFNNLKYADYLTKIVERDRIKITALTITLSVAITLTSVLGATAWKQQQEKKKLHAQIDRMIDLAFAKTNVSFYLNQRVTNLGRTLTKEDIMPIVTHYVQRVYAEYGHGDITEEELTLMILNDLLTTHPDLKFGDVGPSLDYHDNVMTFFEHHAAYLVAKGFSERPYEQRAPYEDAFANTLRHAIAHEEGRQKRIYKKTVPPTQDANTTTGTTTDDAETENNDAPILPSDVEALGAFGTYANLGLRTKDGNSLIVGKDNDTDTNNRTYTNSLGETTAEDYFFKRYPGSENIANAIFFRYIDNHVTSYELADFKTLLRNKVLEIGYTQRLLNEVYFTDPSIKVNDTILDSIFMPKLKNILEAFGHNTIPYQRYAPIYTAVANTADTELIDDLLLITRKENATYKVETIGYYVSAGGIHYQLATVTYHGKPYLLARQLISPPVSKYYSDDFGYVAGQDVAKELMNIRSKYPDIQKQ